jgi:hypothetical protein
VVLHSVRSSIARGLILDYLRQRWEAGCRHGRTLFAEIRKLGYKGCYSGLAKFLSPWRQPKAETHRAISGFPDAPRRQVTTSRGSRQLSPQVAAALLSKVRAELTSQQALIVDTLKRQCPGFVCVSSTPIRRYSDTRHASQPPYCTVECDDGRKARIRKTVSVSRFWLTSDFDDFNWHSLHKRLRS